MTIDLEHRNDDITGFHSGPFICGYDTWLVYGYMFYSCVVLLIFNQLLKGQSPLLPSQTAVHRLFKIQCLLIFMTFLIFMNLYIFAGFKRQSSRPIYGINSIFS